MNDQVSFTGSCDTFMSNNLQTVVERIEFVLLQAEQTTIVIVFLIDLLLYAFHLLIIRLESLIILIPIIGGKSDMHVKEGDLDFDYHNVCLKLKRNKH